MANNLISTALIDDPDPDGTDVYGMIPLIAELPEEEDEDDERDERDERHYDESGADEEDHPPVIEASSIEIELPKGKKLPDDDDEAFEELTSRGACPRRSQVSHHVHASSHHGRGRDRRESLPQ